MQLTADLDSESIAIETVLNLITKLQDENTKKDNIIKLMAKYIAKEKSDKFCEVKYLCDQNCEECVIQHFKDKVTEK